MISYIVSAYKRPIHLMCCIASIQLQDGQKEIIVCDNSGKGWPEVEDLTKLLRCKYIDTSQLGTPIGACCYHDLRYVKPHGDWLCFPSDDSYYVPGFAGIMMTTAIRHGWEFTYCDMLYDPRLAHCTQGLDDTYSVMDVAPSHGRIDKTCFLITRGAFDAVGGWPEHEHDWRDGALADAVVQAGIRHGKAPGVMVVHN